MAADWQVGRGRHGVAFAATSLTTAAVVVSIFVAVYPGSWSPRSASDLTVTNTASSPYALKVMTVTTAVLFPVVPAYQARPYHHFRSRIGGPATAAVAPPDPDQTARQATTPEA